jgi:ABC-2 type transport system permease protein
MTILATTGALPGISLPRAVAAYARLEIRRALRNRRYVMFAVGIPLFFYVLYTGVLGGKDASADPTWSATFMVSMAAYGMIAAALSSAMPIAQERASGWTRQLRITPLSSSGWVATKVLVAYVTALPALVLVTLVAALVNHVSMAPASWLVLLVSLAIGVLPFVGLGLLIGFVLDVNSAQGAMTISSIGLAVLGGLWAPLSTFPDGLATIARMLPSYRFADLGWSTLSSGSPDPMDLAFVVGWAALAFVLVAWRFRVAEQRARG